MEICTVVGVMMTGVCLILILIIFIYKIYYNQPEMETCWSYCNLNVNPG